MRVVLAYLTAVAATYLLASIAATQHVMSQLASMSIEVTLAQRVGATGHDIVGMASSLLPLVAVGLLLAFLVAGLLCRKWSQVRLVLYMAAGAAAMITIHVAMELSFGLNPVPATRSLGGLLVQAVAGATGGLVFAGLQKTSSSA